MKWTTPSPRFDYFAKVTWDYFGEKTGSKSGYLGDISNSGCLFKTNEWMDERRWVRLIVEDPTSHLCFTLIGRVVRRNCVMEIIDYGADYTLFQYGIEFTYPNYFTFASTEVIFALSRRNFSVRSCLNLNSKSPICPGFLA